MKSCQFEEILGPDPRRRNDRNSIREFLKKISSGSKKKTRIRIHNSALHRGALIQYQSIISHLSGPYPMVTLEKGSCGYTECPKIYRKFVLHLLKYKFSVYLSRCSTDLR